MSVVFVEPFQRGRPGTVEAGRGMPPRVAVGVAEPSRLGLASPLERRETGLRNGCDGVVAETALRVAG